MSHAVVDEVFRLMEERGGSAYIGEPVSQLEHALQTADLAARANSAPALIVAALLHDVGHLLDDGAEDAARSGIDARHEESGYQWLLARFAATVADPVRAHVDAKRFLCSVSPEYLAGLSPASFHSLSMQGGPFSPEEARAFAELPWYRDAVRLRQWDDRAKIPNLAVPGLDHYRDLLAAVALPRP